MGNFSNYWDLHTLFTKIKNKIKSVSDSIPTKLSDLTADATHRTVTDTEKSTWNGINKFNNNMIGALNTYTNNGERTIYQSILAYINGLSASSKPRGFVQFLITYNANAMPSDLPSHAKWNYAWGEVYFRHDASYEDAAIILHPYTDDSMIIKQVLNSEEKTWQTVFTDKNTGLSPSDVRTQLDAKVPICKATVDLSSLDQNTYYPVTGDKLNTLSDKTMRPVRICVNVWLNSGTKPSWSTHGGGFSVTLDVLVQGNAWGSQTPTCHVLVDTFSFVSDDISPCAYTQMVTASIPVIWCRGGGKYHIYTDYSTDWTVRTSAYTASGDTISPTTTKPTNAMQAVNGYFGGAADTAYRVKDSNNGRNLAVRYGGSDLISANYIPAFNTDGTEIAPMSLATLGSLLNIVGNYSSSYADFNNFPHGSIVQAYGSAAHAPGSASHYYVVFTYYIANTTTYKLQLAIENGSGKVYTRDCTDGTWGDWNIVLTDTNTELSDVTKLGYLNNVTSDVQAQLDRFNNNVLPNNLNTYTNNGERTIYQSILAYINGLSAASKPRGFVQFFITYEANAMPSDLPSDSKWYYAWGEIYFRNGYGTATIILHSWGSTDSILIKRILNSTEGAWQTVLTDKSAAWILAGSTSIDVSSQKMTVMEELGILNKNEVFVEAGSAQEPERYFHFYFIPKPIYNNMGKVMYYYDPAYEYYITLTFSGNGDIILTTPDMGPNTLLVKVYYR